jgi:hypothetical protein
VQELVGTGVRQGIEPQLRVGGLAPPAVLVLRAIVDEQQVLGGGETLDQTVEQGLGLGIDPVQVFADQEQGLHLAFAQEEPLEGLQSALTPLGRVEVLERAVLRQRIEEGQECWHRLLQALVERQHLAGDLGADGA